jgi:hypothetical protein
MSSASSSPNSYVRATECTDELMIDLLELVVCLYGCGWLSLWRDRTGTRRRGSGFCLFVASRSLKTTEEEDEKHIRPLLPVSAL